MVQKPQPRMELRQELSLELRPELSLELSTNIDENQLTTYSHFAVQTHAQAMT